MLAGFLFVVGAVIALIFLPLILAVIGFAIDALVVRTAIGLVLLTIVGLLMIGADAIGVLIVAGIILTLVIWAVRRAGPLIVIVPAVFGCLAILAGTLIDPA